MNNERLLNYVYLNERKLNKLQLEQIRNGDISEKIGVLEKLQENSNKTRLKFDLYMRYSRS